MDDLRSSIDKYVEKMRTCKGIPAMSVAVVKGDTVLLQKTYGYADEQKLRPALPNTKFCVASLTKAFTATLLAILLEEAG